MNKRRAVKNLSVEQEKVTVHRRTQGCALLDLVTLFNILDSGISMLLRGADTQGHILLYPFFLYYQQKAQKTGLNGHHPMKKPMISEKNHKARVEWTKAHKDRTRKEQEEIIWSDESKYLGFVVREAWRSHGGEASLPILNRFWFNCFHVTLFD
ncbi:gspd-1 [Trypoxylus dichotomus]